MNNPSSSWLGSLAIASAVGSALAAGVFFAFSTFVMPALARMQPREGLAAMQAINVAAVNPWLMTLLFGTGALMAAVAVAAGVGVAWLGSDDGAASTLPPKGAGARSATSDVASQQPTTPLVPMERRWRPSAP